MARYFLRFRHSDTGLAPVFTGGTFFKKASDLTLVTPPAIGEVGNGSYYFDYTPTFDIIFEVDGGASIPTEEVRYISDTISPKDIYIDEPTSQVKDDVWNDTVDRAASTKGDFVENIPGIETNLATANTALTDIKGSGFNTATDSLKIVSDNVDAINAETDAASIANAVWDAATTGNIGGGTMGGLVNTAASGSAPSAATVAAAVWDEALSAHTTVGSFGQAQQLEDNGTAQAGTSTTVTLRAGASAITDFYKNGLVTITSGTGVGQARSITAYDGATKIATVDRAWGTNPSSGSGYIVAPAAPSSSLTNAGIAGAVWDEALTAHTLQGSFGQTLQLLNYGTAVAGAANTVTLAAGASAQNSFYNNALIVITAGTGIGQARTITGYVGGTKVATVDRIWSVQPNSSSQYMIVPAAQAPLDTATIADAVWDEALGGHLTAGTTGAKLDAGGGGGVSFLSNGDTLNPFIVQVSSPKFTQVKITFSEPVVMTGAANGALNLANYSIPGLTLIAVSSLTAQQVLLTTSAQTPDFLYSLSVTNVEDLVGNPIL